MSDTIIMTMKVTANEKTATTSRMISRIDKIREAQFDFIEFEFDQLSAPLKDMVIPLLDDHYDGPITINVESRANDKVFKNEKTILNSKLKQIVISETLSRGIVSYGSQHQELKKNLVDVLFDDAEKPVKESLNEDINRRHPGAPRIC
jgi:hypothetical protein